MNVTVQGKMGEGGVLLCGRCEAEPATTFVFHVDPGIYEIEEDIKPDWVCRSCADAGRYMIQ